MKIDECDDLILEGIAYTSKDIKVFCKDCEYNDYLTCKRFKGRKIVNDFTGNRKYKYAYKSKLNPDGKCQYYKPRTNFIKKLIKKLWKNKS